MNTELRVEGFDDADDNLDRLHMLADRATLRALGMEALEPVAVAARAMVRRRTGKLAASIGTGTELSPAQSAAHPSERDTVEVYVGPGSMVQAITEEFGTVHEAPHPFMRPAWDSKVAEVISRLRSGLGSRLRSITKG